MLLTASRCVFIEMAVGIDGLDHVQSLNLKVQLESGFPYSDRAERKDTVCSRREESLINARFIDRA